MLKSNVSNLVVTFQPQFPHGVKIRIGGVDHLVGTFESLNSDAFLEKSKKGEKAAVEVHGK